MTQRTPVLRLVPSATDVNYNGSIFGGWVLSQMDIAAGIVAGARANGAVTTVAVEAMEFIAPLYLGDLVSVFAEIVRVGRTSIRIQVEVFSTRNFGAEEIKVTEGLFTFVAIDEAHRPRPVDAVSSGK